MAPLRARLSARPRRRRRDAALGSDAAVGGGVPRPVVARRRQRRPRRVVSARLGLRFRVFSGRALLDRRGAVCRHRPVLVAGAVRRRRAAGGICDLCRAGAVCDQSRLANITAAGGGAGIWLCHRLEHSRMGARPCFDRVAVEPDRLRLVGRVSGCHRDVAERCRGRHLRAQFCDRARRRALGPARQPAARADAGGPALGAGNRRRSFDPGARGRRGDPARDHRHRPDRRRGCVLSSRRSRKT